MKTLTIVIMVLICFGCAAAPKHPGHAKMMIALSRGELTPNQVRKAYADYDKARDEYQQTATYKALPYLVIPLLLIGSGAHGLLYDGVPRYGSYYGFGGYGYSGKPAVTITPTGGCRGH